MVAPHVAAALRDRGCDARLDTLYYAACPTLRVQTPSLSRATIRPHWDGMYGLQQGSINFWMPLTAVRAASGLWCETNALEQFYALTRATRFDGRNAIHFTVPNRSPRTRVSLDWRVVPGHLFDGGARLSRLGYFSRADAVGTPGCFSKSASGRISVLHGMPHTAPAVESQ